MLKHQDFFLEAEPMTSDSVSLCGGRQFSRKFSKKEYPLLGDSDHGNAQCSKICKKKFVKLLFTKKKFTKKVPFDECGINPGTTQTKTLEIALFLNFLEHCNVFE